MIHTAGQINTQMPHRMMIKINSALNRQKKSLNGSKILFMGVAYKANINDERESPALRLMDEVKRKGADVTYYDPYIPTVTTEAGHTYKSVELSDAAVAEADCVVFTTAHKAFNVENIVSRAKLVVDLRNAVKTKRENVVKL
jgi:UDP-N-acetyl-D-glucosamine dehydrogenase